MIFDYENNTISAFNEKTESARIIVYNCSSSNCISKYPIVDRHIKPKETIIEKDIYWDNYFQIKIEEKDGFKKFPWSSGWIVPK
ncbi:hypothetical protein KAH81_10055 [bacterium]|nr:hypothetical protein [bacterium]